MINRVRKGSRIEKICYDELTNYPFRWKTIRHKFLNIDLFGAFDVMVANHQEIRLIQCKTGYCDKETVRRIASMRLPPLCKKEIWERLNGRKFKGWRKQVIP